MGPEEPNNELPQNLGLTVGFIGTVIIAIGYFVDMIGEGIELAELRRSQEINNEEGLQQSNQLSQLHNKLDYLINEIEEIKRRG